MLEERPQADRPEEPRRRTGEAAQTESLYWRCGCGHKERLLVRDIWLHVARCSACAPELREVGREFCWWNWRIDPLKAWKFRQLLIELAVCEGEHGCWWCHDGARITRHAQGGQYLLVATCLVGFRMLPLRFHQAEAALHQEDADA